MYCERFLSAVCMSSCVGVMKTMLVGFRCTMEVGGGVIGIIYNIWLLC
jgi:hypothetical protein